MPDQLQAASRSLPDQGGDRGPEFGSGPMILNPFVEHGGLSLAQGVEPPHGEPPLHASTPCAGLFGERKRQACRPLAAAGYARVRPGV